MRTLTAPTDAVLIMIDYLTSAVLFFVTQRSADYFTYQAQDSSGGQPKTALFYAAHTEILKHKQVSVVGSLADEFRLYLANHTARTIAADKERLAQTTEPAPTRYIAFEVRPCVETEGNDESTNVESFLTLAEAREAFRAAIQAAAWQNQGISSADLGEEEYGEVAEDSGIKLFWTVYGVNADGTSEAITDVETEAQAFEALAKLTGISGVSGTVRYAISACPLTTYRELETFYDLASDLAGDLATGGVIDTAFSDSRERLEILIQWALEFERENAGRKWDEDDGPDYIDAEEAFYAAKTADIRRAVPAPHPDNTRRLFDDGRRIEATDGESYAPTTTEAAPAAMYYVGRNDNAIAKRVFPTLAEAEAQIAEYEKSDPAGVHAGDYYIDTPEE